MSTTPTIKKCPECLKPEDVCVCDLATPQSTRLRVLILQHPQEAKKPLGTATLTQLSLDQAVLRVGLSWRSLKAAIKDEKVTPSRWAVLYLGAEKDLQLIPEGKDFVLVAKGENKVAIKDLEGVVLLDGNWQQAKTLWWRNAWLTKLNRMIMRPETASAYKSMRREPRKTAISTIEATALCLERLGEDPEISEALRTSFAAFLKRMRSARI